MDEKGIGKIIGKRIMLARRERDLTQVQLAERVGVTQNVISYWETGERVASVPMLMRLCSVLNKPLAWFFTPFDEPPDMPITHPPSIAMPLTPA